MRASLLLPALAVLVAVPVWADAVHAADDPDISVQRTDVSADIPDGGSFAMGSTSVGVPFVQYLAVGNSAGTLHITSVTVPSGFTIVQGVPSTIDAGASFGLHLRCDAASAGTFTGDLVIVSDDPDESPFEVALSCTVDAGGTPTIRLTTNALISIPDGGTLTRAPGTGELIRIHNDQGGSGPLQLVAPTISAGGAVVGAYIPDDVVSVNGASTYFNVRCATALNSSGTPVTGTFEVSVASNAPGAANPYTFTLECTNGAPPATDPPATDPPATDPPVTDPPATDPPATDVPGTDPLGTEVPGTGPQVTQSSVAGGGRGLPSTGATSAVVVWLALGLLLAGVAVTGAAARRQQTPAQRKVTR